MTFDFGLWPFAKRTKKLRTQKLRQPFWLVVVFGCYGDCVQEHQHNYKPVKPLRFDHMPDTKTKALFKFPKTPFARRFALRKGRHWNGTHWIETDWHNKLHVVMVTIIITILVCTFVFSICWFGFSGQFQFALFCSNTTTHWQRKIATILEFFLVFVCESLK